MTLSSDSLDSNYGDLFFHQKNMIYTQTSAWQCWNYACLNCLQRLWVDISEERILDLMQNQSDSFFSTNAIERILVSRWIIKSLVFLFAPRRIYNYLKEWVPLVCLIYWNNFDSVRNFPYVQDFWWKMQHFVCLVEDCGDRVKYVDQQGENFWDKGYGYIMKDQIKNTRIYKINV